MDYYCFTLKSNTPIEDAWQRLTEDGFSLLYSSEEPNGENQIFGHFPSDFNPETLLQAYPEIESYHSVTFDAIDWQKQWRAEEASVYIDLFPLTEQNVGFYMSPGPGFGDLSHPTTRLVVQMMAVSIKDKFVIDLGCGSGVLGLAALKLGAVGVCGIDIDLEAIEHAKQNAELNGLQEKICFQTPYERIHLPENAPVVLLMNMIYTEQEQAWNSLPQLHSLKMDIITSGVLTKQRKLYLQLCKDRNWSPLAERSEDIWSAHHFIQLFKLVK